jgi:hypothetical protein
MVSWGLMLVLISLLGRLGRLADAIMLAIQKALRL